MTEQANQGEGYYYNPWVEVNLKSEKPERRFAICVNLPEASEAEFAWGATIEDAKKNALEEIKAWQDHPVEFADLIKRVDLYPRDKTAIKLNALNASKVGQIHKDITFVDGKLTIQLQVGHPNEDGSVAGCFPTHAVQALVELHKHYAEIMPSRETAIVITKLEEAWLWLKKRELDRDQRGVLQTDKK